MSWAAVASGVAVSAGGLISNSMNNSKGGQEGQTVYNFNDPQDAAMRAQSEQYMSNVLNGLQSGQAPAWLDNYLQGNGMQQGLQQYLQAQDQAMTFGLPGNAGGSQMDIANSMGAASGIGGQAAMSPGLNVLSQDAMRRNGIYQYIAGLKTNYMTNASQTVPTALYNAAQPRNQIAYNSIPGTQNTAPNLNLSGLGGQGGLITQGLQSLFAPGTQPGQQGGYVPQQTSYGLPPAGGTNYGLPTGNALQNALWSPQQ